MRYQTTAKARILIESQVKRPLTRERRVQALKDALELEEQLGLIVQANERLNELPSAERPQVTIRW